jgi:hypothetical protein
MEWGVSSILPTTALAFWFSSSIADDGCKKDEKEHREKRTMNRRSRIHMRMKCMNAEESGRRTGTRNRDEERPGDRSNPIRSRFERREERGRGPNENQCWEAGGDGKI